jgi:hypothetical protein
VWWFRSFSSATRLALRISNMFALGLPFLAVYSFGRFTNSKPSRMDLSMVIFGIAVVAIAIFLGGMKLRCSSRLRPSANASIPGRRSVFLFP